MHYEAERDEWRAALGNPGGQAHRQELCLAVGSAFRDTGQLLWVGGWEIGPDRVSGESPFGFGSDATVGLATVAQVAGELTVGAASLLEQENHYAAAALLRQLVEAEYLAWAFAEDEAEAAAWLRSDRDDRIARWQPRHLRQRSQGCFNDEEYWFHCEHGGHPTPGSKSLLPDHQRPVPPTWLWYDLATHTLSAWAYLNAAVHKFGWSVAVERPSADRVRGLLAGWRENDPLRRLAADG